LPWPSGFSPSYMKFGTGSWRNVIVAPRSRKSSASFVAGSLVSYVGSADSHAVGNAH
jgi:hypothetical protein